MAIRNISTHNSIKYTHMRPSHLKYVVYEPLIIYKEAVTKAMPK